MRFKLKLLPLFFLFGFTLSYGQYKQMLHQPYKQKVEEIDQLYRNTINKGRQDSLFIKNYTRQIEKYASTNNDQELALEANLLNAYSHWFLDGYKNPDLVQNLILVATKAKIEQVSHIEERAAHVVATHYWGKKEYEKSFEWLLRSEKVLEKMNPEDFPNMAEHLNFIGRCYYYFKDYRNALRYYEKSSKLEKTTFNAHAVLDAQNTLGLCYQKLEEISLSSQLFLKIISDTSPYKNETWKKIASGNLGYNYYLQEDYEKAIPLFKKDIQNALQIGELGLAAGSAIPLADIYIKQNKLNVAKQKIKEAKAYIYQSGESDRLRKLYPVISKWYAANNESAISAIYLDSAIASIDAYHEKYSSLKLLRANQKVEAKDRQMEIEKLHTESRLKISQRNYIILSIALLLMGSLLAYWFRNKYLLRKQEIKELQLENTQKALDNAKTQLENLTLKVRKDNNLISELQKEKDSKSNIELLSQLKSKNILTQNDWKQYQSLFKEVYPNFFPSLLASYPNLSQAEIRCLCLEKLCLTNNEMALVLGVSTNTMRVTKHRIRKKLEFQSQEELEIIIQELGKEYKS